jgi:hypothetical protein
MERVAFRDAETGSRVPPPALAPKGRRLAGHGGLEAWRSPLQLWVTSA